MHSGTRITRNLQKSSQLQVNLFGRHYSRAVDIVQNLDQYVEAGEGGLVHVYALDTKTDVRKQHFKESQATSFLLQSVGQAVQAVGSDVPVDSHGRFLIRTLRKMSVSYRMIQSDQVTTFTELRGYLDLGRDLGLIQDLEATMARIEQEFPNGLGNVEAEYIVRFDPEDVANLFRVDSTTGRKRARETARRAVAMTLMSAPSNSMHFAVGVGYNSGQRDAFLSGTPTVKVSVPAASRARAGAEHVYVLRQWKPFVETLFNLEQDYVDRFSELDALVSRMRTHGRPVAREVLAGAALRFSEMNKKLDRYSYGEGSINVFFVIFDQLVRASSGGRALRQSVLSLTITPPGGETVTKMFVDPAPRPAVA